VSFAAALRNPKLLGASFTGESWRPWHAVAKLLSGEKLDEGETALVLACTGRTRLPAKPPRRAYLLIGRRGAKTRFTSARAVHTAVARDWRAILAPGEQACVLLLAVDKKQSAICMRYCTGLIEASPLIASEVTRTTADTIEFRGGSAIVVGTNDHRLVRGRTVAALIGDECCYWTSDGESASSDEEVVAAVEPAMAMVPGGGTVTLISSVYRKQGLMHRKFRELHGSDESGDICWLADSRTMNPLLPAEIVERALADDPARARSEYLSIWREDLSDFIPRDVIEAAVDRGVAERPPRDGITYCGFVDAAGGTGSDSMTCGIAHAEKDGTLVLDVLRERAPRFVPADVVREFAAVLKSYGVGAVKGDQYSAAWCSDEFRRAGIQYFASEAKSQVYLAALPLLLSGRARLLDSEKLRKQLAGLERRVHAGGRESVDHGPSASAHDDLANAAAGALVAAAGRTSGAVIATPIYYSRGNTFPGAVSDGLVAPHLGLPHGAAGDRFIGD
jgi:hypothetical protein